MPCRLYGLWPTLVGHQHPAPINLKHLCCPNVADPKTETEVWTWALPALSWSTPPEDLTPKCVRPKPAQCRPHQTGGSPTLLLLHVQALWAQHGARAPLRLIPAATWKKRWSRMRREGATGIWWCHHTGALVHLCCLRMIMWPWPAHRNAPLLWARLHLYSFRHQWTSTLQILFN